MCGIVIKGIQDLKKQMMWPEISGCDVGHHLVHSADKMPGRCSHLLEEEAVGASLTGKAEGIAGDGVPAQEVGRIDMVGKMVDSTDQEVAACLDDHNDEVVVASAGRGQFYFHWILRIHLERHLETG